jgi:hypothetical protein
VVANETGTAVSMTRFWIGYFLSGIGCVIRLSDETNSINQDVIAQFNLFFSFDGHMNAIIISC